MKRGHNKNNQLRERILRGRGLTKNKDTGVPLVKSAPDSEIKSSLARMVESYYDGMTIREILKYYSKAEVERQTGVNRTTLYRWGQKLK